LIGGNISLCDPSDNILTAVGVLPDQLHLLPSYFRPLGLAFQREQPRGNWVSLKFAQLIEVLQR
jgi:hypothetical protein